MVCYVSNVAYMCECFIVHCQNVTQTKLKMHEVHIYFTKMVSYVCECVFLTTLCDVVNAAIYDHRYVRLRELLLVQPVSSTPCSCLDSCTPARKIQLSLSFYVQSSKKREEETNKEERRINR